MPTGYYSGQGKTFLKSLGKWVTKKKDAAFDYEGVDKDSACFLVSFFRAFPDYFADLFRSPNAQFGLELPQRLMLRIMTHYKNVFIDGARGVTKTYILVLQRCIVGILWPATITRYVAPNQKQAAALATQAFHQIEKDYPEIAAMWQIKNDRADMFRITTQFGSEFSMYAPRGSNCHAVCLEECAQENDMPFDMETYERSIMPTVRLTRNINKRPDKNFINFQHLHITNASSRVNRAFTVHRQSALRDMLRGDKYEGYVLDIPWEVAVLCGIRDAGYIKDQKNKLSPENFLREMCVRYTGTGDSPMLTDEVISRSRQLTVMEDKHCGDIDCIYVVSHDVAYENLQHNAKCADAVVKLTRYQTVTKRDKYRKQVVFLDAYPPPATAFLQARKLKALWSKYCVNGGETTYLVVDARAVGKDVVDELMKPMSDGLPSLSCINGFNKEIEQPNAVRCLYPLKASRGGADDESAMIDYYRSEYEQGNVELLTSDMRKGIEAYKTLHGIKDDTSDSKIALPYRKTEEYVQQVQNLKVEASGTGIKERRKSQSIQRDLHSACKYAFKIIKMLEERLKTATYRPKSSLQKAVEEFNNGGGLTRNNTPHVEDMRSRLLRLRRR